MVKIMTGFGFVQTVKNVQVAHRLARVQRVAVPQLVALRQKYPQLAFEDDENARVAALPNPKQGLMGSYIHLDK